MARRAPQARAGRGPHGRAARRASSAPRLAEALSKATGREVEVKVVLDPTVVGGVVAHVGDEVFDGSVASRLDDAKQHLGSVN